MTDPEVLSVRRVFDGFLKVDETTVLLDGEEKTRLSLERDDSAAILLHDPAADEFLLVRQYRYPVARHGDPFPLEIVAGAVDAGEMPRDAAIREAREETGHEVADVVALGPMYASPGGTSERIHLFHGVLGARTGEGGGLTGEGVEIVHVPRRELWGKLDAGGLADGKTALALLRAARRGLVEP